MGEAYGELEVLTCEKQAKPVAVMLIGQEGSGRHALMNDVAAQLNQRGGYVSVEAEQIRVRLPYYSQLDTGIQPTYV
ncbi:zeta toxin family protein [Xanthomonas campestris pv. mirabilis]|uniref:zeta toxin family protein n=1 Tax=Xanthomonas euvesicatoria TaxID=456327 RepID=UPI001C487DCF|nr:zeta toxin family protein [Xanthomonas campestris pv. mirabilis]